VTNGSGVFSQSLGEFVSGGDFLFFFAKDFRAMIPQPMAGVWEHL